MKCAKCPARVALHILSLSISPFFCAINQMEEMLLDVEQRLPPLIKVLLNSTGIEDKSFSNEIIGNFSWLILNQLSHYENVFLPVV